MRLSSSSHRRLAFGLVISIHSLYLPRYRSIMVQELNENFVVLSDPKVLNANHLSKRDCKNKPGVNNESSKSE